jgi:hypothetical protein
MRERGKEWLCLSFYLFVNLLKFCTGARCGAAAGAGGVCPVGGGGRAGAVDRATGSNYNRSAADLRRNHMRHLLLEERLFPVVAPPPSSDEEEAQEEEEEEEELELQPLQVSLVS